MTLKNGVGKCSLFVLSANGCFPAKENPNMEKELFDWPIVLQYDVKAKYRLISRKLLACEQALLFGQAKRASRERASKGPRKGKLATISHKFSFPPRKPRDSAKRENCHRKLVAD